MSVPALADLLGIGFGPAALAVAAALDDRLDQSGAPPAPIRSRFLDRQPSAAWQPNMLLPGTDIQHHFLRDYATPRNPRSRFTFPAYLVDTGKFFPFTLMGGYVSREEWSQYTLWTAERVSAPVEHGVDVLRAEPVLRDGVAVAAQVHCREVSSGREFSRFARNLLISVGHTPHVPPEWAPLLGDRAFHSSQYLPRIAAIPRQGRLRFAVIGAGQNAGEIVLHLSAQFPDAQIYSLARNSGFRLYNLGHFSNEAYFPAETDYFYSLDAGHRRKVFEEVYTTNYACVDPDVSAALYRAAYDDHHWGSRRLHMRKRTSVDKLAPAPGGGYRLSLREVNRGDLEELDADVVIFCTGYREPRIPEAIEAFRPYIPTDDAGDPEVSRAFRLAVSKDCAVGLYLNGITEWRHGINSATSFSTMAIKAGEIVADLERLLPTQPAFADGAPASSLPVGR